MLLNVNPYLFIAIGLIVFIGAVFIITFIINRRTPVPKGCEHLKIEESNWMACSNTECKVNIEFDMKKIEKELEEESKK